MLNQYSFTTHFLLIFFLEPACQLLNPALQYFYVKSFNQLPQRKHLMRRLFLFALFVPVFSLLSGCAPHYPVDSRSRVQDGKMDLSAHDFSKEAVLPLDGAWAFYPDETLVPEEIAAKEAGIPSGSHPAILRVPGVLEDQFFNGKKGPHFGAGTCVLDIALPKNAPELALKTELIQTSSRVFLNGKPQGAPIITDYARGNEIPPHRPTCYRIPAGTESLRIVIEFANYWANYGTGILTTPELGTAEALASERLIGAGYESFVVGMLFIIALYHLMLFLIRRKDKAILVFALITIAVICRQISVSEKFLTLGLGLSHFRLLRMEFGSVYLICGLFALYFTALYPKQSIRPVCIAFIVTGSVLLTISLFASVRVFTSLFLILHIFIILSALNALFVIVRAIRQREPQSVVMLIGLLSLALPTGLDVLTTYTHLLGRYLMPLGLIPFIMAQTYLLAKRDMRSAIEAETLKAMNEQLKKLDAAKTAFFANVSHELRTPLTLIKAPVEAIRTGEYGDAIPKDHQVFSLIQINAVRLLTLIQNLLNLTRLESAQPYELVPVDIARILPAYVDEFSALAAKGGIELKHEMAREDLPFTADINIKAFETIFFNLMSNAIKFTPRGGTITVWLSRLKKGGKSFLRLEVADTGIGMKKEEIKEIFGRYRQIYDTERHHYDGSGLGLTIAQGTARALGGELFAASEPDKGSSFFLDLPASDKTIEEPSEITVSAEAPGKAPEEAGESVAQYAPVSDDTSAKIGAKRVLVVEDQADMRRFIAQSLSRDYAVFEATDGANALERLDGIWPIPDLILCDIMMPTMDGTEFLAAVKKDASFANIPFIFLTARDESNEKIKLLHDGIIDYIMKPFSLDELRARIAAVLSFRDSERNTILSRIQSAIAGGGEGAGPTAGTQAGRNTQAFPTDLSQREVEVLTLVVVGFADKDIAEKLGISTRTASNHVASILRKTGLSGRQALQRTYGGK